MSPRTKEQYTELRSQSKSIIEAAALELFGHQGYMNTSIAQIAQKAGVSKGLLYNYY
nr:helix-turn-helix transcriptional regulator [Saprospiraceae bacterium]